MTRFEDIYRRALLNIVQTDDDNGFSMKQVAQAALDEVRALTTGKVIKDSPNELTVLSDAPITAPPIKALPTVLPTESLGGEGVTPGEKGVVSHLDLRYTTTTTKTVELGETTALDSDGERRRIRVLQKNRDLYD